MLQDEIKEVLEKQGITAYRVWKETGIHQSSMSKFFAGQRMFSVETLNTLLDYLGYELTIRKKRKRKQEQK